MYSSENLDPVDKPLWKGIVDAPWNADLDFNA